MRAVLGIAAFAVVTCRLACPALACSPIADSEGVFFESDSAKISPQALAAVKSFMGKFQYKAQKQLPPNCERLTVTGYADTAEETTPGVRIDISRAEAVRDLLVNEGFQKSSMVIEGGMGKGHLVPTPPNIREPQNRWVNIWWRRGEGRWRCDPATKLEPAGVCGEKYTACYWELTDGTICNFDHAPDPNPAKYSVDPNGEKIK
jgi:hypothetical protein